MSRANRAEVSCVAAAALLAACSSLSGGAPGAVWGLEPTVVHFSHQTVDPPSVRIASDGNLTWVNMAPDTRGFVVFPASIASSFRCQELGPYFRRAESAYRSLPISAGMESETVQLPCPLAPGTYDYEIWLMGIGFGAETDPGKPEQILRAKIVVE